MPCGMTRIHCTQALLAAALALTGSLARAQETVAPAAPIAPASQPAMATSDDLARLHEEVDDLRTEIASRDVSETHEPMLRIYGFMDMGLQKIFMGDHSLLQAIVPSAAATFVLGNVDLYFDAQPTDSWRALIEIRFTNLPDGEDVLGSPVTPYTRTDTTTYDTTSANGVISQIRLGSIVIERAYIEWHQSDLFTLRAGEFLTPFGIWNVDHGTPTLIALMLPQFIRSETFPIEQIGVQLAGVKHLAPWDLGYNLYVTNGRSPTQFDLSDDKAIGGRFYIRRVLPHPLTLGVSFYFDSYLDQRRSVVETVPVSIVRTNTVEYSEQSLAADASLDLGSLRLRSEGTMRRVVYDGDEREPVDGSSGTLFWADRVELDAYVLAAYQLPHGFEPFLYFEYQHWPTELGNDLIIPSVGLNIHFTASTQLKMQAAYTRYFDLGGGATSDHSVNDTLFVASRLVMAF